MTSRSRTRLLIAGRYAVITAAASFVVAAYRLILHANQTTVALTFLVLVLLVATRWRLAYSVYLSVLCTALYNFFFLPPIGKFTIADPQNWVTLIALLCASFLVSHLSNQERRTAEVSETRRKEVERLYEFSEQLLLHDDLERLARRTPSLIAETFELRGVALYVREHDAAFYSDPNEELVPASELKRLTQATETKIGEHTRLMPLALGMKSSGALALTEGEYSEGIYEAIAGLVAIALERASALERFSRLEASREGERLRSALLDSVTHELRTPLTAIRAAATMLAAQPDLPREQRQDLYLVLEEESARLNHLIGQAVEMAQLDSESLQVRLQPTRLRWVVEATVDEMRLLLRGRCVDLQIPDDLPEIAVDRELMRRVLRQLLENAAKYSSPRDPIAIAGAIVGNRVQVSVSDRGPGIEAAELPFVFDKFFRGRASEHVQGSGMGLAIAKAILRAHRGGIEVKSVPGEGTSFTFWLPLRFETVQEDVAVAQNSAS